MEKPLPKSTVRVVQAEVQRIVGKDFDRLVDLLKKIESQNQVLIIQNNAAARDLKKHHEAVARTLTSFAELLSLPDQHLPVINTIKEFLNYIK